MKVLKCKLRMLIAKKENISTQKQLIEDTGLSHRTIKVLYDNKFEMIHNNTIEVLCEYFQCGIGDLFELVDLPDEKK